MQKWERTMHAFIRAYRAFKADASADGYKAAQACVALDDMTCEGGNFLRDQQWIESKIKLWEIRDELLPARQEWLATPMDEADCRVTVQISGNSLVSILNALDMFAHQADAPWYATSSTRAIADTLRDILCRARLNARKV